MNHKRERESFHAFLTQIEEEKSGGEKKKNKSWNLAWFFFSSKEGKNSKWMAKKRVGFGPSAKVTLKKSMIHEKMSSIIKSYERIIFNSKLLPSIFEFILQKFYRETNWI